MGSVDDQVAGAVRAMYEAIDRRDWEAFRSFLADDLQTVDERTGRWTRGHPEQLVEMTAGEISAAESFTQRLEEVDARVLGDGLGLVTYVWYGDGLWEGTTYHVRCPASAVLRRTGDRWQAVLLHSVEAEEKPGQEG